MDVAIDMNITRRTNNKGFHRIAKLVGSGGTGGVAAGNLTIGQGKRLLSQMTESLDYFPQ